MLDLKSGALYRVQGIREIIDPGYIQIVGTFESGR